MRRTALMRLVRPLAVAMLALAAIVCIPAGALRAEDESSRRDPSVGYVYPAGGCRGSVLQVLTGGQNLRGVSAAYVSGQGVSATVVRHVRPLTPQQMQELRRRLAELADGRRKGRRAERIAEKRAQMKVDPDVELPDHPLLRDLDKRTPKELRAIATRFLGAGAKRQMNSQIAETVEIEVTIDARAAPGLRELRLGTPAGLTNPLRFDVGVLPEANEDEPVEGDVAVVTPLVTPVVLNGQILPGDADRFRIRTQRGQHLVVNVSARRLIPYLADAVPGWFQATAALFDPKGDEVAFSDDYRFETDPVLLFEVPVEGDYVLEIRDALYRGREDFVYRVTVGEEPFITRLYPLGGRADVETIASISGWNLPFWRLPLDTGQDGGATRFATAQQGRRPSNPVPYAVDDLPECDDVDPNDDVRGAQGITLPTIVNGRIAKPGDVDVFAFTGRAGDRVVAEVEARRLNSPLDSLLTLTDEAGHVLAWNDDHPDAAAGLITHQADSYLTARLAADGVCYVKLSDTQRHGGPEYAYRLRVGPPRPDFEVFLTPSSVNVAGGRVEPVRAHVVRRDGFDGEIRLVLTDAPDGFALDGASIPGGLGTTRLTLTAPRLASAGPIALHVEARATIDGREVRRPVLPADLRMQAFAYRHLVPAQELLVDVTDRGRGALIPTFAGPGPVRLPLGGAAIVRVSMSGGIVPPGIRLELDEPPAGVTIEDVSVRAGELTFVLRSDAKSSRAGTTDNLIVEVLWGGRPGRSATNAERGVHVGFLPAIPFEIVAPPPVAR